MLFVTTIGLAIVLNAFHDASMFYTLTAGYFGVTKRSRATEALAFIQGTGLELVIKAYGLGYEAEDLRQVFYRTFNVKAPS